MNNFVSKYLIPIGTLIFFSLIGDWFGSEYFKGLSDPNFPLFFTRALGGLSGFAAGASWLRASKR